MEATAEIAPRLLPRFNAAPVSVQMGFTSEPVEGVTPRVIRIEFELSRHINFHTAGLPSCPRSDLFDYGTSIKECTGSLVGDGSVTSEISAFGRKSVTLTGKLLAFYSFEGGHRHILAQVTTGRPLALTYVIPFTIVKAGGPRFGKDLIVPKQAMAHLQGACFAYHPGCFSNPYTLEGVYSYISNLRMSLHRIFLRDGRDDSFVSASCPAPRPASRGSFPLLRASLDYPNEVYLSDEVTGTCRVP